MGIHKIPVLNAGFVELKRFMGGDEAIVEGARICFQSDGTEKADRNLLKMLVREKHTSPMEHCTMTFKVKAPIFVFRQWHRHRIGMSYNELSLRYCEANPEFFVPELIKGTPQEGKWLNACMEQHNLYMAWKDYYERMGDITDGRARELARPILPIGLYTEMLWTCNGASAMHFIDLRTDTHAQKETRDYAYAVLDLATIVAPFTFGYKKELIGGKLT